MGAVRDKTSHRNSAAIPGRRDQHHLGHRFFGHVAEIHPLAHRQTDRFDPRLQVRVGVEAFAVFIAGYADIGGAPPTPASPGPQ
jgi:hypothetical protein